MAQEKNIAVVFLSLTVVNQMNTNMKTHCFIICKGMGVDLLIDGRSTMEGYVTISIYLNDSPFYPSAGIIPDV